MRRRQLEWGAEIGRAVVNFKGPIVFVVISRYHGGAFVVFFYCLGALFDERMDRSILFFPNQSISIS